MLRWYEDAKSIAQRDPAACGTWQVFFLYSGYHAVRMHRLAHWMQKHHMRCIARGISQLARFLTGIEIHPGAKIGRRLFIDHGMGLVVGETAEIGDDCTLYHGVTLGGTGKDKGKRHPTLGDRVLVGAGAKILGPFRVGDDAMIGANSVVLHEVPDGATVVGVPGRVVKQQGQTVHHNVELDHDRAPDPIEQDICRLMHRVMALEKRLDLEMAPLRRKNCPDAAPNETTGGHDHAAPL
ncbi:MAG: serine O-acetyltransferase [Clostridiales bacterium]|nr:serine O-acetyltransferase [Clostridiales bacterium]